MSAAAESLDFVLIGRGTLALGCCKLLAERGLPLRAVVSDDEALQQWAKSAAVPCLPVPADLAGMAWEGSAPVLLSIANEQLISPSVLELFTHAINFHDGPLPRYAGSHVTSWALMARERTYAVSWHHMTSYADAGDILLQASVPITANETALTLNAKCHDAALESFPLLVEGLIRNEFTGYKQNLSQRTFFPRDRRPDNAATLDWNREADDLSALVRALNFGPYVNRLGLPKLWFGEAFVAVQSLNVRAARSTATPGTVVSVTQESLVVATVSHDVALRNFLSLDGRALSVTQLVKMFALREGMALPTPSQASPGTAAAVHACGWKHEAAWMDMFKGLKPLGLPLRTAERCGSAAGDYVVLPAIKSKLPASQDAGDFALVVVLAYLARVSGAEVFDIGLKCNKTDPPSDGANALLASTRPFSVALDLNEPFERFRQGCMVRLAAWRSRKAYLRDAVMRYPGLVRPRGWNDFCSWPISVDMDGVATGNTWRTSALESSSALTFDITAETGQVTLAHKGLEVWQLDQLLAQLTTLAEDCLERPGSPLASLALLSSPYRATLQRAVLRPPATQQANTNCTLDLR
ncbi:formyltransferase family protein [Polaromonas sp.]|uniref:formyltransferase family protein n=1 Tax=Polaromonas sp. TaxID=1869339 RepID=UPI002FC768E1